MTLLEPSRKKCIFHKENICTSFSLADYRNNYYLSESLDDIFRFYAGFENAQQLIQWMKERPTGTTRIHEINGDKDVIVVIPTADFNGDHATECRNAIFKGLHMIFVESGEIPDSYFNYSHSCNIGIKKALGYDPKWVVVSNDDMKKIDEVEVLRKEMASLDHTKIPVIFTKPSLYHSYESVIGEIIPYWSVFWKNLIDSFNLAIVNARQIILKKSIIKDSTGNTDSASLNSRKKIHFVIINQIVLKAVSYFSNRKKEIVIYRHLPRRLMLGSKSLVVSRIFLKRPMKFIMTSSFAILSGNFCLRKDGKIFDETYINGMEDLHLSLEIASELKKQGSSYSFINYRIGDKVGSTLGKGEIRRFRYIANEVYFSSNSPLSSAS
jgi:hypothetical protein